MANNPVLPITLKLHNLDDLFAKPEISPFSEDYQIHSYTSGIEFLADELYANTSYDQVQLTLILPSEDKESRSVEKIEAAIKRYCQSRLKDVEHDIQATRWRGFRALIVAFIALFVFIGASKLVDNENSILLQIISEGLSVAGWVALWFPLELLTFNVWEHRLDRKIYTMLEQMEIRIGLPD